MLDFSKIAPETPRLLTRAEYEQLANVGMFEGERLELIEGWIIRMSPISPEHATAVDRLLRALMRQVAEERALLRVQNSFAASDHSELQPDFALVPNADYSRGHPTEAFLIIEVANSSLAKDRDVKAKLYARSGVLEYWVVNLIDGCIEVFSDARDGLYRQTQTYLAGETVKARSVEGVAIAVSDIIRKR